MPHDRLIVELPMDSNVTRDKAVNVWHFEVTDFSVGILGAVTAAVRQFYDDCGALLASDINEAAVRMKHYRMSDPEPRTPVRDTVENIGSVGTGNTAHELAAVLSFRAAFASGVNPARRRGRIFLGPLSSTVIDSGTGLLTTGTLTVMAAAATTLVTASLAAVDWSWVVYSQAANQMNAVLQGHVDNAPDVQRRRGETATVRTVW